MSAFDQPMTAQDNISAAINMSLAKSNIGRDMLEGEEAVESVEHYKTVRSEVNSPNTLAAAEVLVAAQNSNSENQPFNQHPANRRRLLATIEESDEEGGAYVAVYNNNASDNSDAEDESDAYHCQTKKEIIIATDQIASLFMAIYPSKYHSIDEFNDAFDISAFEVIIQNEHFLRFNETNFDCKGILTLYGLDELVKIGDKHQFNPVNSDTVNTYKATLWNLKYYIKEYFDNDFGHWIGKSSGTIKYSYSNKSFMINRFIGMVENKNTSQEKPNYIWINHLPDPITEELEYEKEICMKVNIFKRDYYNSIHMYVDDFDGYRREKIKLKK